ncbi:sulfate ABC transporter ATP-binding protein [Moraxella caviae]|uniref:Sulfate ABC transporter ATP-binding protein n=1 Tax=Moraxella caviae TaxID=34060 RepID=A0A1T0A3C8_9GAMM|nr:sulfate ABC transporter ATP-binding protein [Moraxella caviae]OOR90098.1 sulfate ABC transporter ATP-binding protein [Moraxella caviae]STZ14718.1 Sulfate/thiosulfate import ATP-binding protein CysA [Moraxella caviae]VEW11435.1 Sulfate/thiosulfate import ATP-binding protein CysA [Moraxella caviae]VEW14052.1 Sulfate/thiosulfate import ATP-binding protein CysA [Moraxella caviae]
MSIHINNIHKKFGDFTALNDINFTVNTGELTTLLGPSGCGKTTLLRIIAGLEFADSGRIFFDETDVTDTPVQKRGIGFVFQNYALFRHKTVAQNIAFGLNLLKNSPSKAEIDKKVDELLQLVQLPHTKNRYPHELSGGQRQRIALARALATSPKLLLLDEPFGALDAKVRKELRTSLKEIQKSIGITAIMVTHDQEEAAAVSDTIVVMNHGKVEQIGTPNEILARPNSEFVVDFLGL